MLIGIRDLSQVRDDSPEQQWHLQAGSSHIQLAGTTLCIDAGQESENQKGPYSPLRTNWINR